MSDDTAVKQRLFVGSTSAKFVVHRSGVGRLKHVSIKHMFLQQLLRQKVFSIHKVPTRINPADLNTKKLSLDRRNLLSSLCGLFPHVSPEREGDEVLFSRRVHRQVTARLVQALQGLSVTLLQGCFVSGAGEELQQGRALRGHAPEQGLALDYNYVDFKVFVAVAILFVVTMVALCTMYPGRRLGPERRSRYGGSSSSRPGPGGDREGDDPTRRSRTTSRDRRGEPDEDVVATLHKRLGLMFMKVVEGNYTPRERVTPYGINQTLKHLLGAAKSLDDGYYFVVKDSLNYLGGPEEHKAVKLLNDMVHRVEQVHGPLPTENGDLSKLLFQRYKEVLQDAGYPVLRLEEMVYGPDDNWESESSYTIEQTFNENASRSRDDTTEHSGGEGERDSRDSRGRGERRRHWESSSTEEWTRREALHAGEGEGLRGEEGHGEGLRGEGGEEESMVGPTTEGESLSEHGGERFNVFEPEGEPSERGGRAVPGQAVPGRAVRNPLTYPDLTPEEVSGEQYPGYNVDLTPFSQYERMSRLCQCLEQRIEIAVANNDYETYERWARELSRVEQLQADASDLRPGEEGCEGLEGDSSRIGG